MARSETPQIRLYKIAMRADNRFSHRLKQLYGKRAGDMRYVPSEFTDPTLKKLHTALRKAMDALHKAWRIKR